MANINTPHVSNRIIVIGAAIMIVLYLAFGHAMADEYPQPARMGSSMVLTLPPADMAPTGAPKVLDSHYKGLDLRK